MANKIKVRFLQGSQQSYNNLPKKDLNTFYKTESNLYLGEKKLTSEEDINKHNQKLQKSLYLGETYDIIINF